MSNRIRLIPVVLCRLKSNSNEEVTGIFFDCAESERLYKWIEQETNVVSFLGVAGTPQGTARAVTPIIVSGGRGRSGTSKALSMSGVQSSSAGNSDGGRPFSIRLLLFHLGSPAIPMVATARARCRALPAATGKEVSSSTNLQNRLSTLKRRCQQKDISSPMQLNSSSSTDILHLKNTLLTYTEVVAPVLDIKNLNWWQQCSCQVALATLGWHG
jgi:hypothetical protein